MLPHTPGPWYVDHKDKCAHGSGHLHVRWNGLTIADVHAHSIGGLANARLIAAAPELVTALKAIAEGCAFPEDDIQRAVVDRARAALALVGVQA